MDRLMLIVLFLSIACSTTSKPGSEKAGPKGELSQGTLPAVDDPMPPPTEGLAEPSEQEQNRIYTWLAQQETGFEIERLEDCEAQLLTRADHIVNKTDLHRMSDELQAEVRDSLSLYHWCYYHMLGRLEYQLEQQNLGVSYQDRLDQFLRESKALFIVADCLDRTRQSMNYRSTLQKKYINLSQTWFGRKVSPMDAAGRPSGGKAAGPYVED